VPICRAAFGALEIQLCGALYLAMEKRPTERGYSHQHRVRRGAREIALAVLLTIAAVTFITAAWLRGTTWPQTAPYETARKPGGS
jgi:hypothetical protein